MMPLELDRVAETQDVCGEGVVWHPQSNAVFWTDINRGLLHRFVGGAVKTWHFDQPVTAVLLTSDEQRLLLVLGGRIVVWDIASEAVVDTLFTLPEWPSVRCNDARVDPAGVLWFGTMQNNVRRDGSTAPVTSTMGEWYSFSTANGARSWYTGFGIANTIVWSPDGRWMYFGDTLASTIYRCEFDARTSAPGAREVFFRGFERGLPDGSAMDSEGCLWNCRYGGTCIVRVAPDGTVAGVIETPMQNPTTCTFAGPDLCTLFVTSASDVDAAEPANGALFRCEPATTGLATTPFRL